MRMREEIPSSDAPERNSFEKTPFFSSPRGKMISGLFMLVIVALILVYTLSGRGGTVSFEADEKRLGVAFSGSAPVFIEYGKINTVDLLESISMDMVVDSLDWDSGYAGTYRNSEYGDFLIYAYSACGEYIVVHYDSGVLVFNGKNKRITEKFFRELSGKIA